MTISSAASLFSVTGTGLSTLSVTSTGVNDLWVVWIVAKNAGVLVTGVTGGNATNWQNVTGNWLDGSGAANESIWIGQMTSTGSTTINVTYSASITGVGVDIDAHAFHSSLATPAWSVDKFGRLANPSSTTVTFPTLTPVGSYGELYWGHARVPSSAGTPAPASFVAHNDNNGNPEIYNTGLTSAATPTMQQAAGTSQTIAVLISEVALSQASLYITQTQAPAQPTYTLTVNGVDYSSRVEDSSWTVTQQWSRQGATATFNIIDEYSNPSGGANLTPLSFPPMSRVVLTDTTLNQVIFSGLLTDPVMNWWGPTTNYWNLSCTDWTHLTDHSVVVGDFVTQNAQQVVLSLLNQSGLALGTQYVMNGPQIPRIQINYLTLSQALTKICQYSSMNAMYGWYVDENLNLWFNNQSQLPNPTVTVSDYPSDFVSYNPRTTGAYQMGWQYMWDATNIQNEIFMTGANYDSTQTDNWVSSSVQTVYPLAQTPDSGLFNNNATLTIGGTSYTVSVLTGAGASATTQYVVTRNAAAGWALQPGTNSTFPSSGAMVLVYPYLQPTVSVVLNGASISQFSSLPNQGKFQAYISNSSAVGLNSANNIALTQLNSYSLPQERMVFTTTDNFTGHYKAGQLIQVKNQFVSNSLASYAPGLNEEFLVIQNHISGTFTGYRTYNTTAVRLATGAV